VEQVLTETRTLRVTHYTSPEAFRDYFKTNYGPTISAYRFIADDPDRVAALDHDLAELGQRFDVGTDSYVLDWEYLIFIAQGGLRLPKSTWAELVEARYPSNSLSSVRG
jgi:hypothetical protein